MRDRGRLSLIALLAGAGFAAFAPPPGFVQPAYPNQRVNMYVGFADTIASLGFSPIEAGFAPG